MEARKIKMTNIQRMKSDTATADRRNETDKQLNDNRLKNDEKTLQRRNEADNLKAKDRLKNDEKTADRRESSDANPTKTFVIALLILVVLTIGLVFLLV